MVMSFFIIAASKQMLGSNKNERPGFVSFGTFTRPAFILLMWAAAFVLQDLNNHSSGTSVAAGGFKAPPFQAGQLAGAPRRPDG